MAVNRDTLKTIAGLVVIALIIVGAFLYGDAQHQNQVRQDQNAKRQQASQSVAPAKPSASASGNVGGKIAQAPSKTTPSPSASATPAPSAQPGQGGVSQTPQTGAADELIPLAALAIVLVAYRASLPRRSAR